jgi:hypothetical protein
LSDEETTAYCPSIHLPRFLVDDELLGLDNGAGLALVVDAEDLGAELEFASLRGDGEGLEELDEALAVDDAFGVEFGDAGDGGCGLGGVEVDYFLAGAFEGEDDWVGGEDGELGVEFLGRVSVLCCCKGRI